MDDPINKRYLESDYLLHNPAWDMQDSPWKAKHVSALLKKNAVAAESFCEIGCGAGAVLGSLQKTYPEACLTGYDIAPDAERFWQHLRASGIRLYVDDFFEKNKESYAVIMLLDVLEHVVDPHQFLIKTKPYAEHLIVHFPLDLSAMSVLREKPLLHVRRKVGHIHYFTKGLALELLDECGYDIVDWQYTGAAFNAPQVGFKTRLSRIPRYIANLLNKDAGVRLFGGETLMVLAKAK